jgi:hypothetical protein
MAGDEQDALYALLPDEFVAARNELAKALRRQGNKALAEEVARLRRPSLALWALNQAARALPQEVQALLRADDRLHAAQAGRATPDELRAAMHEHRTALRALAEAAEQRLPAGAAAQARALQATLQAAAAGGAELRDRLRRGVLSEELQAPGFDALAGLAMAPARAPPAPADQHAERKLDEASVARAHVERKEREKAAPALRVEAQQARASAERLAKAAEAASQKAVAARASAQEAEHRAQAAAQEAREARASADQAEQRAAEAEAKV